MNEWVKIFKYRESFTIDVAARLYHGIDPILEKIHNGILNETKEDIKRDIRRGIISVPNHSTDKKLPFFEQEVDKISFINWCGKRGVSLNYLLPDREDNITRIQITDDMPITLKAVISLWNEFGSEIKNQNKKEIQSRIEAQFSELTEQKRKECAQILTGGQQPGRTPDRRRNPRAPKEHT